MFAAMQDPSTLADRLAQYATDIERQDARARAEKVHDHVLEQLLGKDWSQLQVLELDGDMVFPEKLYRRKATGGFEGVPILIRIPREPDLRKARVDSRVWAMGDGLDLDRDRDLVEQMETLCILSAVILNGSPAKDPRTDKVFHEPWEPDPKILEKRYERSSLTQLWAKIESLAQVLDPRPNALSPEETLVVIAAIAKARSISPLHVYGPGAQNSLVVSMATLLLSSLDSR